MYVFEVVRHGSRVPAFIGDAKYHTSGLNWERSPNSLTKLGEKQMNNLGISARTRYIEQEPLLSNDFNAEEFTIRAASDDRSVRSAYAFMLGLYPKTQH